MSDEGMSKEEKRIRLAKGPFGTLASRHALRFGKAAFFGLPPRHSKGEAVNSGTITFVDLGNGPIGITCAHVMERYRQRRMEDSRIIFQIGHFDFDPLNYLIAENRELDLATIDLGQGRMERILTPEAPGNCVHIPPRWPPQEVREGDVILSLGGFPGAMRKTLSANNLLFGAYSISGVRVDSSSEKHFACHFERQYWVSPNSPEESREFCEYGGLSGGPVFIDRKMYFEFAGIIKEYNEKLDVLYASKVSFIRRDGTILGA
ncbi:MAG: hypothetical protein KGL53_06770 [Elusimicrobia bacterium]|nr:hypothetical protein [Elusimicrobiota bacterium]